MILLVEVFLRWAFVGRIVLGYAGNVLVTSSRGSKEIGLSDMQKLQLTNAVTKFKKHYDE